jgi:hypothetical protein
MAYPAGVLVCLCLTIPDKAMADDAENNRLPAPLAAQSQGEASIAALLAKLDKAVADDHPATTEAVAATVADILALLPNAPPSDVGLVLAMPAHFANRAHEAEAGGRLGEANRFAMLGGLFEDLFNGTPKDPNGPKAAIQSMGEATSPPEIDPPSSSAAMSPFGDIADNRHTPVPDGDPPGVPVTSSPNSQASGSQPPGVPTARASDSVHEAAPAKVATDEEHGQSHGPGATQEPETASIAALLDRLDKQIADDPLALPQNDTVVEIVADLLGRLPDAPPSDAKLVLALPAHFADRARESEASGHQDAANRFVALGGILGDLFNGMTLKDAATLRIPRQAQAKEAATVGATPSIAVAPEPLLGDPSGGDGAPLGNGSVTSPIGSAPSHSQPGGALAGQMGDSPPDTAPPKALADGAPNSWSPAPEATHGQGEASIVALVAKLDRQIAEDRPATTQNQTMAETVADILALLPKAPPTDARLVLAMPVHFANRAREAEAAGRRDEASRFAMLGGLFEDLFNSTSPDTAAQQTVNPPKAEPPLAPASDSPLIAAMTGPPPGDTIRGDRIPIDDQDRYSSMTPSSDPVVTSGQASAEIAGGANDRRPEVTIEPKPAPEPAAAVPSPSKTAQSSLPFDLAMVQSARSDTGKPPRAPDVRIALREMPGAGTSDANRALGRVLISPERAANPRAAGKAAPAAPAPRVALPPRTKVATAPTSIVDPQCRAIALKFQIGEEPSDAERSYLRHGCRQQG